jgi:hypothetical protein
VWSRFPGFLPQSTSLTQTDDVRYQPGDEVDVSQHLVLAAHAPEVDSVVTLNGDHGAFAKLNSPMNADVELEGHELPDDVVRRASVEDPARAPTIGLLPKLDK